MPADTKKAEAPNEPPAQPTVTDRRMTGLKARQASLKKKLAERIPTFPADRKEQSTLRTQRHLEQVNAEIKKATKL